MYSAIFEIVGKILKAIWPFILGAILFFAGYQHGSEHIKKQWDAQNMQQAIESTHILDLANNKIDTLKKESDALKVKIEETQNAHQQTIDKLSISSRDLLVERLRRDKAARCTSPMSADSKITGINMESSATGTGSFLEESGQSLIDNAKLADELTESLRSCRAWVADLENNKQLNSIGDKNDLATNH